jgi:hypothetical protein
MMKMNAVISPATDAVAVTNSDTVDLTTPTRWIMVTVAGNVKVTMLSGNTVTFTGLVVGTHYPFSVKRVWAPGTTATGIIALY